MNVKLKFGGFECVFFFFLNVADNVAGTTRQWPIRLVRVYNLRSKRVILDKEFSGGVIVYFI